ncbi:MAG: M28 family peptidase [Acidobacteriota bacterium]
MKLLAPLLICLLLHPASGADSLRGFPDEEARSRQPFEQRLRATAEANKIREFMSRMAAEPHHAGSPASRAVAEYALARFREFGLDARIETFHALIPYPTQRSLELLSPVRYTAKLREPVVKDDPDSSDQNQLPTFNAYSGNGEVTAPLLYANYGLPEDYALLRQKNIDPRGKIVLVRYGRSFRGIKAKVAAENGAVACLIYSDPRDDGYFQGDIYPKGPFRPAPGVQRGSVMDLPLHPGDPLTPNKPSTLNAQRLRLEDARTVHKIPVLPISWEDARPLLEHLDGELAPLEWRGAVPVTYHLGPGPAVVHLKLQHDNAIRPIHNVVARLRGSTFPDQIVLYGNHHDAWVNGAADPISGAATVLEAARILAKAAQQGWRPKRSLVFALWDAEEYGLVGSTEWAEQHRDRLQREAVAYFNSDTTLRGPMSIQSSPSLEKFIEEWLRDTPEPAGPRSLLELTNRKSFHTAPLGSGSDYTAFAHHLGIASLNAGFEGNMAGVYHSVYDSLRWFQYFGDPDYVYTTAFAGFMATGLARMADAYVIPFDFSRVARFLKENVEDLKKLAKSRTLLWEPLEREIEKLDLTARAWGGAIRPLYPRFPSLDKAKLQKLNEAIYLTERSLTRPEGLPGRDWYKGLLSAPGKYTGYGAKTLPGIREALETQRLEEAAQQLRLLTDTLATYSERIRAATALAREF